MWTPNMGKPVVTMLTHPSQPVSAISVHHRGQHIATAGKDGRMKIWDIRTFKLLHDYFAPQPISNLDFSQSGLLAASFGSECHIWQDPTQSEKHKAPYMKYKQKSPLGNLAFAPFEDVLGLGLESGFASIVVPGAGEVNFDAFEVNLYMSKKQR